MIEAHSSRQRSHTNMRVNCGAAATRDEATMQSQPAPVEVESHDVVNACTTGDSNASTSPHASDNHCSAMNTAQIGAAARAPDTAHQCVCARRVRCNKKQFLAFFQISKCNTSCTYRDQQRQPYHPSSMHSIPEKQKRLLRTTQGILHRRLVAGGERCVFR